MRIKSVLTAAVAAGVLALGGCADEEPPEELEPVDDAEQTYSEGAETPEQTETQQPTGY